jgi:serine/threonine protein kinase
VSISYEGAYGLDQIVAWTWQLATALGILLEKKLFHGDIKAANLLLDHDQTLIVADFGVSADKYKLCLYSCG